MLHSFTRSNLQANFLFHRKNSRYSEKDAAVVVRQMLKVAAECHLHGLVHRDMKPEVKFMILYEWLNSDYKAIRMNDIFVAFAELPIKIDKGGLTSQGYRFWPF